MNTTNLNRRDFLKYVGVGTATTLAGTTVNMKKTTMGLP